MGKIKDKYKITRDYIGTGKSRPGIKNLGVKFLVAHETANDKAGAINHKKYFGRNIISASAHTFIDEDLILEIIPLNEKAWHVQYIKPTDNKLFGDDANDIALGVELCRPGSFAKAYDKYVWYFAYLCKRFKLDPKKHIVSHKTLDPERRSDPESWLNPNGVTWEKFINDVQNYFDKWDVDPDAKPADDGLIYKVQIFAGSKAGAEGAAKKAKAAGLDAFVYSEKK